MLTLIFIIGTLIIFCKLFVIAVKAAWSVTKIISCIFFLPIFLVCLATAGVFIVAIPILALVGLFVLVGVKA